MAPVIPDSVEKGNPNDKLVLYGFGATNDTATSMSPFVGKVETFLRMNDIPYEVEAVKGAMGKSPKHTVPFIEHGYVTLADSTFIIQYLANTYADNLKVKFHTDAFKNGIAVAAQIICEDHLLYGLMWHRWVTDEGYEGMKTYMPKFLPFPLTLILPAKFRKQFIQRLYQQGFARHSRKDVMQLMNRSLSALSGILGKSKYITGDELCPEDSAVFAVLDPFLNSKVIAKDPMRDLVLKYENLVSYVNNIRDKLYPEDNPSKFRAHML